LGTGTFALISSAIVAAAFVQGTTGVGFALIVAPVMGFAAPDLLPVSLLLLMLPLNAFFAWRERGAIDGVGAAWISGGRFVGTFGGASILAAAAAYHHIFGGAATVLAALHSLFLPSFDPNRRTYVIAGVVTGITETATGIGGPPLALIYQHQPPATFRATIALCFLVGEVMSIALLWIAGQAARSQFANALAFVPALLLGAALSRLAHRRVNARVLRVFVLCFAAASGCVLLLRG
jgi:uncharacterized membrane protein YfcA